MFRKHCVMHRSNKTDLFFQLLVSGKCQKFDYGIIENYFHYGQVGNRCSFLVVRYSIEQDSFLS